ncbi:MAG: class II aldolase/adducin family protein [Chloroflexi bacterium]|nr:class II aldolase/adducin family protein [Chloroflexota bacterium]
MHVPAAAGRKEIPLPKELTELKEKLTLACRVIATESLADGPLGHISYLLPSGQEVLIKPTEVGFEEMTEKDMVRVTLDGVKKEGHYTVPGEAPLHLEVYRTRPQVRSIVHLHPPYTTILSTQSKAFVPLCQEGVLFLHGVPRFDDTAEVITTPEMGQATTQCLGDKRALLMTNHGLLAVGESVEEACLTALYLEKAIKLQVLAEPGGSLRLIPLPVMQRMYQRAYQPGWAEKRWPYYARKAQAAFPLL